MPVDDLTEKVLLYAGAVELAGAVRHRQQRRHAVADWMAMERERGISITSTALQFDHDGPRLNLLDTPGHQDFGEDTYLTLLAAYSAVMVLDAARGIEPQAAKLFAACWRRRLPVVTFVNTMDREGRDPFALLDEIAARLGLPPAPLNWPIGGGAAFRGAYDPPARRVLRFARALRDPHCAPMVAGDLDDSATVAALGAPGWRQLREEIALLAAAGIPFERAAFLRADLTPVSFGGALTNLAVEPLLAVLCTLAPPPGPRPGTPGPVRPEDGRFSGFSYKIQANMDPRHHDRTAFLRACSGHFRRGMPPHPRRLRRQIRVAWPHRLFAQGRELLEEAFAGDVVGLSYPGLFAVGDTLSDDGALAFPPFPRFPPERVATIRNRDIGKQKQFRRGLAQLEEEGLVQVWRPADHRGEPILAAGGGATGDRVRGGRRGRAPAAPGSAPGGAARRPPRARTSRPGRSSARSTARSTRCSSSPRPGRSATPSGEPPRRARQERLVIARRAGSGGPDRAARSRDGGAVAADGRLIAQFPVATGPRRAAHPAATISRTPTVAMVACHYLL